MTDRTMPADPATTEDTTRPAEGTPRRRGLRGVYWGWWIVGAAFLAQFVAVGAQNYVVGAFVKPMTDEFGWSRSEFLFSRSIGQTVMAFTGFFIGAHVDRHGARRLMQVGIVVLTVSVYLMAYVTELWQWWLLNGLIVSAGSAMVGNLVVNVTISKWFVERRGRASSTAAMGVSFAGVLLTPLAALLVAELDWRTAWKILAVGGFLIIAPLTLLMRRAPEDHGLFPDGKTAEQVAAGGGARAAADFANSLTRREALRTRAFYCIAFSFGLGALSIGVMLLQAIPYMTDAGYSGRTGALMITVASVPSMLSKPAWGWLVDRVDPRAASLGFFLNGVSMVVIVVAVRAHADWVVYGAFFTLGLGWGGLIPLQEVVWASYFGRRYLGAVRSAGLPFALTIQASSPFLVALYFDRIGNYDGAFLAVAGLAFFAVVLMLFAKKPEVHREAAVA